MSDASQPEPHLPSGDVRMTLLDRLIRFCLENKLIVGLAVLLLIITAGTTLYFYRCRRALFESRLQTLSFALLTLALVTIARACVVWGVSALWVPVPLFVMMMCLVYDQQFGVGVAVFYALLVRLASPGADPEFFVLLVGGLITALFSGQVRTHSTLIKVGLLAGA